MIAELRKRYNSEFTDERYSAFVDDLNSMLDYPADFRVSETPLFLPAEASSSLRTACDDILSQIFSPEFRAHSADAIPPGLRVPDEAELPLFLQIDFALTEKEGAVIPQLIELQGFPSLYAYQYFFAKTLLKHFPILSGMTPHFGDVTPDSYLQILKEAMLDGHDPKEVILLEIEPEKQKTRIDFAATKELFGITPVCISKVIREGKKLYYTDEHSGKVQIRRIYNRVILDELVRRNFPAAFSFTDELEIEWAGHPNWFFKISKHTLPFLRGRFVPECYFLDQITEYPDQLEQFVLKPLYSFAGLGVEVDINAERLDNIRQKKDYILQKKVEYAPAILTPDGYSKAEIRMMFVCREKPLLVNNLVRMSKGKMMGVDFNKNKTWVGSSCAFNH